MAIIVETIVGERRLLLGAEDFTRKMVIGTNWQKIRIGLRLAFRNSGGSVSNASFVWGVCQGTEYPFIHSSCIDFIGGCFGVYDTGSFGLYAGPPAYYGFDYNQAIAKKGSTITQVTSAYATRYVSCAPSSVLTTLLLDITKGGPKYSTSFWRPQTTPQNRTYSDFLTQMENESSPTPADLFSSDIDIAYSGDGLFDSVCLHWKTATPAVEIADLSVLRFY